MLSEPILKVIKRELRKMSEGVKVDLQEVEQIVRSEVLRRNLVEGEEAEEAQKLVTRFYKKDSTFRRQKKKRVESPSPDPQEGVSLSDRLLEESNDSSQSTTQQKNSPDKK